MTWQRHALAVAVDAASPRAELTTLPCAPALALLLLCRRSLAVADNRLRITATVGALVGPPWSKRQNGLVFRELVSDSPSRPPSSLYFESHCDFDAASVAREAPVDVVVSPVVTAGLGKGPGAGYPLTMGDINLEKLLKILKPKVRGWMDWPQGWPGRGSSQVERLAGLGQASSSCRHGRWRPRERFALVRGRPRRWRVRRGAEVACKGPCCAAVLALTVQVLIPLLNSEIDHVGPLASIMYESGTYAELPSRLAAQGLGDVRVEFPAPPGEAMAIAL